MCKSQLHYFIKKEYLVFLEDSMNHTHPVWIDITEIIIKTVFAAYKPSYLFPDVDTNGDPVKEAAINAEPQLTKAPGTLSPNPCFPGNAVN